jgi:hypothetical protein
LEATGATSTESKSWNIKILLPETHICPTEVNFAFDSWMVDTTYFVGDLLTSSNSNTSYSLS